MTPEVREKHMERLDQLRPLIKQEETVLEAVQFEVEESQERAQATEARLQELREEEATILHSFPEIRFAEAT